MYTYYKNVKKKIFANNYVTNYLTIKEYIKDFFNLTVIKYVE